MVVVVWEGCADAEVGVDYAISVANFLLSTWNDSRHLFWPDHWGHIDHNDVCGIIRVMSCVLNYHKLVSIR